MKLGTNKFLHMSEEQNTLQTRTFHTQSRNARNGII